MDEDLNDGRYEPRMRSTTSRSGYKTTVPNDQSKEAYDKLDETSKAKLREKIVKKFFTDETEFYTINQELLKLYKKDKIQTSPEEDVQVDPNVDEYDDVEGVEPERVLVHKPTRPYRCGVCAHLGMPIDKHRKDRFHIFPRFRNFDSHRLSFHHRRPFCEICREVFDNARGLLAHLQKMISFPTPAHVQRTENDLRSQGQRPVTNDRRLPASANRDKEDETQPQADEQTEETGERDSNEDTAETPESPNETTPSPEKSPITKKPKKK